MIKNIDANIETAFDECLSNQKNTHFDSDSADLFLDACTTKGLAGFKSDFIEHVFVEENLGATATASSPATLASHGIAQGILTDDLGQACALEFPVNYTKECYFRLLAPQLIKKFEQTEGAPPEKQSKLILKEIIAFFFSIIRQKQKYSSIIQFSRYLCCK